MYVSLGSSVTTTLLTFTPVIQGNRKMSWRSPCMKSRAPVIIQKFPPPSCSRIVVAIAAFSSASDPPGFNLRMRPVFSPNASMAMTALKSLASRAAGMMLFRTPSVSASVSKESLLNVWVSITKSMAHPDMDVQNYLSVLKNKSGIMSRAHRTTARSPSMPPTPPCI